MKRSLTLGASAAIAIALAGSTTAAAHDHDGPRGKGHGKPSPTQQQTILGGYQHLVVIYQENHSFDNIYGSWGKVGGKQVEGLRQASASTRTQVGQDGKPFTALPQNDVNLTSPPLPNLRQDPGHGITASAFDNRPFQVTDYIRKDDTTCAPAGVYAPHGVLKGQGLTGGCTEDLVHRFYQEQFQINGGRQDRYVQGSDALGLTMGTYDTRDLAIYKYLHSHEAPNYVVMDHFFQGAFGGSFLNHQYLVAGRAPEDTSAGAMGAANSKIDANGMPTSYAQYRSPAAATDLKDGQLTVRCGDGNPADYLRACGNLAVNTTQPGAAPYGNGARMPLIDNAKYPNIGDRLDSKGITWSWYAGGWDDAAAGKPGPLFQFHHQPFAYFANTAPGGKDRDKLQDETKFFAAAKAGTLPAVSFVKPYGAENEHPGYASEHYGSNHLVELIKAATEGPEGKNTLVLVTYDEFGGQWDHVAPPGKGSSTRGAYDAWGPGTRIPALAISSAMKKSSVDHTVYDTTSILATIEDSFGLAPVGTRDGMVNNLGPAIAAGKSRPGGPGRH
ncbi:phospholipase C [Arsenicicoccus sp. oral taxon 190]|uniref:phospholipase C n=1 Tax=Arsenicicoccus sp. oral taxon 190 TaxID=1658671 RepID=UPI00067A36F2|nr:alkaline phosphatase family protein [Arsenicicoccus sp. oral taxon 190]AKT50284.1 phosphoesterase [Arsenicicoccus sp. oral taxon 190]